VDEAIAAYNAGKTNYPDAASCGSRLLAGNPAQQKGDNTDGVLTRRREGQPKTNSRHWHSMKGVALIALERKMKAPDSPLSRTLSGKAARSRAFPAAQIRAKEGKSDELITLMRQLSKSIPRTTRFISL
jgi:hypothetical protein